jgi:hypothetical protein
MRCTARLFTDLLTAGGRIHFDTHIGRLPRLSGTLNGVTLNASVDDEGGDSYDLFPHRRKPRNP